MRIRDIINLAFGCHMATHTTLVIPSQKSIVADKINAAAPTELERSARVADTAMTLKLMGEAIMAGRSRE